MADTVLYALPALAIAITIALAVTISANRNWHPAWLMLIVGAPMALLMANPDWRLFTVHGFMHASMVYEIYERGVPPEMPLAAGMPLRYFYGVHFLISTLMKIVPIAPPWAFACLNALCLVASVVVLNLIARLVSTDRRYRWFAIFAILFGVNAFLGGPVGKNMAAFGLIEPELRVDLLHKFITANNNQIGFLLFCTAFLGLARLVAEAGRRRTNLAMVAFTFIAAGFMYPFAWVAIGLVGGICILYLLWAAGRREIWTVAGLFTILGAGTVLVLPWILALTGGKSDTGAIGFSPELAIRNGPILLFVVVPTLAVAFWQRAALREYRARQSRLFGFLVAAASGLLALFLVMGFPTHSEYKFILFSQVPLGLLIGIVLSAAFERSKMVLVPLAMLMVLPFSYKLGPYIAFGWPVAEAASVDGRYYVHDDLERRAFHDWVISKTPGDSVFIDSYLTIPPFARRSLLIGLDLRRESGGLRFAGEPSDRKDGWGITAQIIIEEVNGIDSSIVERRRALALELLDPDGTTVDQTTLAAVANEVPGRSVYLVTRDAALTQRHALTRGLTEVFTNGAATVYRVDASVAG